MVTAIRELLGSNDLTAVGIRTNDQAANPDPTTGPPSALP